MRIKPSRISKILSTFLTSFLIVQLTVGLFLLVPKPQEAKANGASWYSTYSYRVKIPVSATVAGAQTDHQMQIVIHSKSGTNSAGEAFLNENLQDTTNFNDIRFTAANGTTLKDFWIQKVEDETGGRKATVYVELDTPASGSTDYYLYYGKSADTSTSSYDNTFTKDYGESGLLGLWHMEEGSGSSTVDSSGNSNTGTITGSLWSGTDGGQWGSSSSTVFATGSALNFDANDYVSIPTITIADDQAWSISMWIKPDALANYLGLWGNAFSSGQYTRAMISNTSALGVYNDSNDLVAYWGSTGITAGVWNFLVFTCDGASTSTIRAYLNTTSLANKTAANSSQTIKKLGTYGDLTSGGFDGLMDEMRIYNRALSSDEISRLYIRSKYASIAPTWASPDSQELYALTVSTQAATLITLTGATLNGLISGFGGENSATVYFKYGLSQDNLDQTTASQAMSDHGSFSQAITGLVADTTYYFQAFVQNSSTTTQGSILSFKTAAVDTDYYRTIINSDGSLTFTNKSTGATILSSAPTISFSYVGYSTSSNGSDLNSTLSVEGDNIAISSVDDTNAYVKITHQYSLNSHSPYVSYTATLQYKQNVYTTEERFDFIVPTQSAQVMTRDLQLNSFVTSSVYWSDIYTPKVVKFTNGLAFLGSDTMESMRLQASSTNSQLSFYSDYKENHPHYYYVKNGGGSTTYVSETQRFTGDTYSASVSFAIDPNRTFKTLVKNRQPYGYDATFIITNHADGQRLSRETAIAYGSENASDPDYGAKGIAGRGIGWTESIFLSRAGAPESDLEDTDFKALIGQLYQDGVEIVGHSITAFTDSRSVVSAGLTTLSQYNAKNWIDHGAGGGTGNWEDLGSQGALKGDDNYILDIFDEFNYQYAWSFIDLTTNSYALNIIKPSATSDNRPYLFYNNRVDDNLSDNKKIYLWSTISTYGLPNSYYTNDRVDTLVSERGVHISHAYYGDDGHENKTWYNDSGTIKIYPTFDSELEYIASKRASGLLWSPTMATMGDYLVPLKDVLITYNSNGTITVTNNSSNSVTGITLLAESNIQSVTIDNNDLVSFGGSYGDKEIVLPTLASGAAVVLNITYGTKDSSTPTIVSDDTGKNKVNEITGYWDSATKTLIMTAEAHSGSRSFTVTIPSLANKTIVVRDITSTSTDIGEYIASATGTITFSGTLGSIHTFSLTQKPVD